MILIGLGVLGTYSIVPLCYKKALFAAAARRIVATRGGITQEYGCKWGVTPLQVVFMC